MAERRFNYPKHPLFGIAPILYNWRGDPRHDEYTSHLVGRIRAGRYTSDLWDCNSLYLDYSERLANPADRQLTAIKSRHKLTPAQLEEYRKEVREAWAAGAEGRAQRAEQRAQEEAEKAARFREWRAEQERQRLEYEARVAQRQAEKERRDREWRKREAEIAVERAREREAERARTEAKAAAEQERSFRVFNERQAILTNKWQCQKCNATGVRIERQLGGYGLTCIRCGAKAWGDHKELVGMLPKAAAA